MEYQFLDPPFEMKNFSELSSTEAKEYFEWFMNQIPKRIEQLLQLYKETGGDVNKIDYSPESLIEVWSWYISKVEIVEKTDKEKLAEKALPEHVHKRLQTKKISVGWTAIVVDIGIYFAECFIKENPSINWGYVTEPKNLVHVNKPVLKGFKTGVELDPSYILNVQAQKIVKVRSNESALLNLFNVWSNDV